MTAKLKVKLKAKINIFLILINVSVQKLCNIQLIYRITLFFHQVFKKWQQNWKTFYFTALTTKTVQQFMFSNVANRPTGYKTGIKTIRWRAQQKGSYLRNYYVASIKTKAENFIGVKCESHGKVKSYWRPLGFCIFFYQSSRSCYGGI